MSLKRLLGGITMAAAPFLAPQVSSFLGLSGTLGATAGAALSGAAIGGLGAAIGGYNPAMGGAYGGISGGLAGYMSQPAAPAQPPINTGPNIAGTQGPGSPPMAAAPAVPTVATPSTAGDLSMTERMRRGAQSAPFWAGLTQLGLAGLSAPPSGMTGAEQAVAAEVARNAASNRELFEQRRDLVNRELQSTGFSPERAYAQAQMSTQRALSDIQRGRPPEQQAFAARRAAIEGARLGTAAVGEGEAAAQRRREGLINSLPKEVPIGVAGLTLPLAEKAEARQSAFDTSVGRATGLTFGGLMSADAYRS
jgi:hypothetical protein